MADFFSGLSSGLTRGMALGQAFKQMEKDEQQEKQDQADSFVNSAMQAFSTGVPAQMSSMMDSLNTAQSSTQSWRATLNSMEQNNINSQESPQKPTKTQADVLIKQIEDHTGAKMSKSMEKMFRSGSFKEVGKVLDTLQWVQLGQGRTAGLDVEGLQPYISDDAQFSALFQAAQSYDSSVMTEVARTSAEQVGRSYYRAKKIGELREQQVQVFEDASRAAKSHHGINPSLTLDKYPKLQQEMFDAFENAENTFQKQLGLRQGVGLAGQKELAKRFAATNLDIQRREARGAALTEEAKNVPLSQRKALTEKNMIDMFAEVTGRPRAEIGEIRLGEGVTLTPDQLFSDKDKQDAAKERLTTAGDIARIRKSIQRVHQYGEGSAGLRAAAAEVLGGLAGQIHSNFGNFVSEALSGVSPGEITKLRQDLQQTVVSMIPDFSGEETGRVTERELSLTQDLSKLRSVTASWDQVRHSLYNLMELKLTDSFKQDLITGSATRWDLNTKQGAGDALRELRGIGIPDTQIVLMLQNLRAAEAEFRRTGFFTRSR